MSYVERRKNKRVSDVLWLNIEPVQATQTVASVAGTFVANLSVAGLGFSCQSALPTDIQVRLTLHLASQQSPLHLTASVVSSIKKVSSDGNSEFKTRMIFGDIDEQQKTKLDQHIEHVINLTSVIKELPYRQIA